MLIFCFQQDIKRKIINCSVVFGAGQHLIGVDFESYQMGRLYYNKYYIDIK